MGKKKKMVIIIVIKIRQTSLASTASTSNPVNIVLDCERERVIQHNFDTWNIQSTSSDISGNEKRNWKERDEKSIIGYSDDFVVCII